MVDDPFDFDFTPQDPFKSEDAKVGGSIEDLSPAPYDQEKDKLPDIEDSWAEVRAQPLLKQISDICAQEYVLVQAVEMYDLLEGENADLFDDLGLSVFANGREKQIISLGVNIVGILFPHLAPLAAAYYRKATLVSEDNFAELRSSGRWEQAMKAIERGRRRQIAATYEMTLEQFEEAQKTSREAGEGVWGEEGDFGAPI